MMTMSSKLLSTTMSKEELLGPFSLDFFFFALFLFDFINLFLMEYYIFSCQIVQLKQLINDLSKTLRIITVSINSILF